jgi:hypothetical protein
VLRVLSVSSIAGLTDRCTVAAYLNVTTTRHSGPNYTTSPDTTRPRLAELSWDLATSTFPAVSTFPSRRVRFGSDQGRCVRVTAHSTPRRC